MEDFNILDTLGAGSFGTVYAVSRNGEQPVNGKPKLYAMKFLEKTKVYNDNLAKYALTERNCLSVAANHPMMVGLDYAF